MCISVGVPRVTTPAYFSDKGKSVKQSLRLACSFSVYNSAVFSPGVAVQEPVSEHLSL